MDSTHSRHFPSPPSPPKPHAGPKILSKAASHASSSRRTINHPPRVEPSSEPDLPPSDAAGPSAAPSLSPPPPPQIKSTPSLPSQTQMNGASTTPSYLLKPALKSRVAALDAELASIDAQIASLRAVRAELAQERRDVLVELEGVGAPAPAAAEGAAGKGRGKEKGKGTDYAASDFEWSRELRSRMKDVWGFGEFRMCQEGVCNAVMDGRDVVAVMPTGAGKSITFQLPALLTPGVTVVISPLLSLIHDQILHLHEAGVAAVCLTGSTSKAESKDITARLVDGKGDIKLCYVTPEKISKSKTFLSVLEKMARSNRLARLVVDEGHCVSAQGHDFRPDYKKLSMLRTLFPQVPILVLTATLPPKVLDDVVKILKLPKVVDARAAPAQGTCYFSAPLYRKNLHYSVLPKPSAANAVLSTMVSWILHNHPKDSGIVYVLSKKDAETVAHGLHDVSNGQIKTDVYHADVPDSEKQRVHQHWREGKIKVVVATIAFGMGIDKADVRFVLHHSMSKSCDGYYQESGRAGRDGKDADCVMFFRPQDASRLASLIAGDVDGAEKLHAMLDYATDLTTCRKILFARYFSSTGTSSPGAPFESSDSSSSTTEACKHCDNCLHVAESIDRRDVTADAHKILKVLEAVGRDGGRLSLGQLADLVRGLGGGAFAVAKTGKKGKEPAKGSVDLEAIAGGKVTMSKEDVEHLLVRLTVDKYLQEDFAATAYAVNVYLAPGPRAIRISRLTHEELGGPSAPRLEYVFPAAAKTKRKSAAPKASISKAAPKPSKGKVKKKAKEVESDEADEAEDEDVEMEMAALRSDFDDEDDFSPQPTHKAQRPRGRPLPSSDDDVGDDWETVITTSAARPPPAKRARRSGQGGGDTGGEVIVIED